MAQEQNDTVVATGVLGVWKPAPPDHPIHNLVGRVASNWAHIEHLLDIIIWEMIGTADIVGACITSQIPGAAGRLEAIKALCMQKSFDAACLKLLNQIGGQINVPQTRRNRIVHDPWYVGASEETAQFKAMPRNEYEHGFKPVDEQFILRTLEMIEQNRSQIAALRRAIQIELSKRRL
jgi:hypothetical protein